MVLLNAYDIRYNENTDWERIEKNKSVNGLSSFIKNVDTLINYFDNPRPSIDPQKVKRKINAISNDHDLECSECYESVRKVFQDYYPVLLEKYIIAIEEEKKKLKDKSKKLQEKWESAIEKNKEGMVESALWCNKYKACESEVRRLKIIESSYLENKKENE